MFNRLGIILFINLIILSNTLYSQTGSVKLWTTLYGQAVSIKDKADKVVQMTDVATAEFEPLVISILQEQLDFALSNKPQDKREFDIWVNNTIKLAAKLKLNNTAPYLAKLYDKTSNPRLRGECAYAIGMTGNREFIEKLNYELSLLNEQHRNGNLKGKEENVDGIIRALGLYKDKSSFSVIFYCSLSHYPEKWRKMAQDVLSGISDKPSLLVSDYIKLEKNINLILEALNYSNNSKSPDADKVTAAKTALSVGLDYLTNTSDKAWENARREVKNVSTKTLGSLKAGDPEVIVLIEKKWDQDGKDTQGNLTSIDALEKIATDDAVRLLVKKLGWLNQKTNEGAGTGFGKDEGEKIMIALIKALGNIGNRIAEEELAKVATSSLYGKTIQEEAKKALQKLK